MCCTIACCNLNQWCQATIPAQGDEFSLTLYDTQRLLDACAYFSGELHLEYETAEKKPHNCDIPYNQADVVVADGFTGNMILKLYEGVAMALMDKVKGVFMGSLKGKLAAAMVYNDLKKMKKSWTTTSTAARPSWAAPSPCSRSTAAPRPPR